MCVLKGSAAWGRHHANRDVAKLCTACQHVHKIARLRPQPRYVYPGAPSRPSTFRRCRGAAGRGCHRPSGGTRAGFRAASLHSGTSASGSPSFLLPAMPRCETSKAGCGGLRTRRHGVPRPHESAEDPPVQTFQFAGRLDASPAAPAKPLSGMLSVVHDEAAMVPSRRVESNGV